MANRMLGNLEISTVAGVGVVLGPGTSALNQSKSNDQIYLSASQIQSYNIMDSLLSFLGLGVHRGALDAPHCAGAAFAPNCG